MRELWTFYKKNIGIIFNQFCVIIYLKKVLKQFYLTNFFKFN